VKPENRELLVAGLAAVALQAEPAALDRLVAYHDFLLEYNEKVNLTGFTIERESVIKNLLNALAPWRHIDASRATADVGSGAGMPGIPLAIMLGMKRMVLIESKRKKCDFLRDATQQFAPGVEVVQNDVNMIERSFGQVVTIAYGTLAKLVEATDHMRAPGTRLLAWKGRRETIDAEIAECRKPFRRWQVEKFTVPEMEGERHLCILQV
jgi:16S rRNA (guanine527-N7)-methyltransferase